MSDSFISILKNPEDWQFISQLTRALFLLKKDGKDFSLRNISTLTNTPFKSVSRKIERLYNSLSDTPFDTGSDTPFDTESKVVKICKSFSYNLNKCLSDTPFDTAVTHWKISRIWSAGNCKKLTPTLAQSHDPFIITYN